MLHSPRFSLAELKDNLYVERLDTFLFRGMSLQMGLRRVFGGQVLAQALNAAFRSVPEDRRPHSMHAYFLRPGDTQRPIIYEVDPIRDGRSFSTRRVVAKQNGEAIFNTAISFHKLESGLSHQMDMPVNPPSPDTLTSDVDRVDAKAKASPDFHRPFTLPIDVVDIRSAYGADFELFTENYDGFWFRFKDVGTDDPVMHRTLLAFISDKRLMGTGLRYNDIGFYTHDVRGASLDHALWFHSDINMDQWIFYYMDSPRAERARNFNRGSFYTQGGTLIASSAQEGLVRVVEKTDPKKTGP